MILTSFLLASIGVRVSVFGEGRLCFKAGSALAFASTATLTANSAGLLADNLGHAVFPAIRVAGSSFTVSMDGTVTVGRQPSGRLMLQKPGGEVGHPGEGTFGVLQVGGKAEIESGRKSLASPVSPLGSSLVLISVHPRSEVVGERIVLGEIADLSGEPASVASLSRVDIGETPIIGNRRTFSRWSLVAALHDAGIPDDAYKIQSFPRDVTIARKGQTVDTSTILDAATAEARRVAGGVEPTSLPGPVLTPVLAPLGELKIVAKASRNGDKISVRTTVLVDGHEVADRALYFGAKLDGVKAGDAVRVYVACGGAAIETDAKAKTGGSVGDAIQILTADGTALTATVTGTGKAEVKL